MYKLKCPKCKSENITQSEAHLRFVCRNCMEVFDVEDTADETGSEVREV